MFTFIKDAGEKLFGANKAEAAADQVAAIDAKLGRLGSYGSAAWAKSGFRNPA